MLSARKLAVSLSLSLLSLSLARARALSLSRWQTGKWTADMLATKSLPQTPDVMRTKKLTPCKLHGPFPKGPPSEQPLQTFSKVLQKSLIQ